MVSGRRGGGLPAADIVSVCSCGGVPALQPLLCLQGLPSTWPHEGALTFWAPRENEHGLGIRLSLFFSLH